MRIVLALSLLLVACSDDTTVLPILDAPSPDEGAEDAPAPEDVPAAEDVSVIPDVPEPQTCDLVDPEVVTFRTADDVELEAAYFAAPAGRPAVVLFHMIPPSNNRGNYRRPFIDRLVTQCIGVLNVDRRGAGGSGGVAQEAYVGPGGALDARAAFEFLLSQDAAPDGERLAMVGASNGTTSLNDYASSAEPPAPLAAAVLLSGGAYTEAQVAMTESGLRSVPTLFAYPEAEAAWNVGVEESDVDGWRFEPHTASAHGTRMLDNEAAALSVVGFLREELLGTGTP